MHREGCSHLTPWLHPSARKHAPIRRMDAPIQGEGSMDVRDACIHPPGCLEAYGQMDQGVGPRRRGMLGEAAAPTCTCRECSEAAVAACDALSSAACCLDPGDVDLLHRHHGREGALCLGASGGKGVRE